jgi:hypothetical protein
MTWQRIHEIPDDQTTEEHTFTQAESFATYLFPNHYLALLAERASIASF